MQEFRQIAASLQPVKAALTGSTQRSISRELALSAKREIGDCYIWGSLGEADACDPSDGALQCCGLPAMVANTHALDVIQVRVGAKTARGRNLLGSCPVAFQDCIMEQQL
jgi:hypothetical protein